MIAGNGDDSGDEILEEEDQASTATASKPFFSVSEESCASTVLKLDENLDPPGEEEDEQMQGESDAEDDEFARERRRLLRRRRRGRRNQRRIVVALHACKYDSVAQAARAIGWREAIDENEEFNVLWADSYIPFDTIAALNKYQKVQLSESGQAVSFHSSDTPFTSCHV